MAKRKLHLKRNITLINRNTEADTLLRVICSIPIITAVILFDGVGDYMDNHLNVTSQYPELHRTWEPDPSSYKPNHTEDLDLLKCQQVPFTALLYSTVTIKCRPEHKKFDDFLCDSFYHAVSISNYMAPNGRMAGVQLICTDLEENGIGLITVQIPRFSWKD
jgi:hypothetical protein